MAGTIGLVQNDIKRVLAYSTVSQLGYMFMALGVGAFDRRHLPPATRTRSSRRCCSSGRARSSTRWPGEQDIRKMGGLQESCPSRTGRS